MRPSRRLWEAIEPIHSIVYFAPEPAAAAADLGLRGWWMGYFAGRFGPVGPVGAAPAAAMAFGFAPTMVARALPDAWRYAAPDDVVQARVAAASSALRRALPADARGMLEELADVLTVAGDACSFGGRPLAAAWSAVHVDDAVGAAWLAATVLREHRGDGHVLAAVNHGLTGLETTLTLVATGAITREVIQPNRGWRDDEWDGARAHLEELGVLDAQYHLTPAGSELRRELEAATDRLAADPADALIEGGAFDRCVEFAASLGRHLVDTGVIPVPNPIGAPRPG